jgi:outer membrane protein
MTALNRFATFLALGLLALPLAALADTKLGWVDMQRALEEIDEGKAAKAQLKKSFDEMQKQLDQRTDEVKKLDADFQKQALVMAPDAKAAKAADIERKKVEVQQFFMGLQQELSNREREITRGIFDKLVGVSREVAEAEGFTMIVDRNAVVYAPSALDITNEVVRKYNVRYPAKGGAAPAKKAEPPAPTKK